MNSVFLTGNCAGEMKSTQTGLTICGHAATNIFFMIWGEKREKKIFSVFLKYFQKKLDKLKRNDYIYII